MFSKYLTCKGRTDIYVAFIEKSIEILKNNGINTFIIPYAYTNQNYAELSRIMLVKNYGISEILDTSNYFVFESAAVKNIILRIMKTNKEYVTQIKIADTSNCFAVNSFKKHKLKQEVFLTLQNCRFETKKRLSQKAFDNFEKL